MSNTLQAKAVALFATVAMLASMLFALPARAQTVAELQAQIQSLLATIAQLQAQMQAMQGGSNAGSATYTSNNPLCGFTFTRTHKIGDRGGDVKQIQMFLNMDADTKVAVAGPGSAGNETTYFGPATKRAVEKFQAKYATAVLAPVGLSAPTGVWGPSTRAKANALLQSMCQAQAGIGNNNVTVPQTTGLTVTAATQPENTILPRGAQGVPFTRFTLTAGADDVEVESVVVKLTGLVDVDAFDGVYLLDEDGNMIGDEEDFDSDTRKAEVGDMFRIRAGESKTFTVAANRATATGFSGEVASISVVAINTDETVNGTLPITGAQHTINESIDIASAIVNVDNESGDVQIGDKDALLATIEVSVNSEDVYLKKLRVRQTGSADLKKAIKNVKLDINGDEYDADKVTDEYIYFSFSGEGVLVEQGSNAFELKADIKGTDDTLQFEVENDSDIVLVGKDYGYNANITSNTADAESLTIKGGSIVAEKNNDYTQTTVAKGERKATIASFVLSVYGGNTTADVTIKVKQTNAADATSNDYEKLDNVAIYDENGKRISRTKDANITDGTEVTLNYSNVRFPEGEDMVYYIKADIDDNTEEGDEYQVTELKITDEDDSTRTDTVTNFDKVEVKTGKLALSYKAADDTQVADDQEVELGKIKVDTSGSIHDVELRKVAVKINITDNTATISDITDCRLYDENDNPVSETEDPNTSGVVTFNFPTNPVFDKGAIAELSLVCTLSANFTEGSGKITLSKAGSTFDYKAGDDSETGISFAGNDVFVDIVNGLITVKVTGSEVNKDKTVKTNDTVVLGEFEIKAVDTRATIRGIQVGVTADATVLDDVTIKVNGSAIETVAGVLNTDTTIDFNDVSFNLDPDETATIVVEATTDVIGTVQVSDINVDLDNDGNYSANTEEDLTLTGTAATISVVDGVPVFTKIDLGSTLPNEDNTPVLAFKVRADGSNVTINDFAFKVEDAKGVLSNFRLRIYDNPDRSGAYTEENLTLNNSGYATAIKTVDIADGETYSFEVVADVTATGVAGTVRVMIEDDAANTVDFSAPSGKTAADFLEGDLKQRLDFDYDNN